MIEHAKAEKSEQIEKGVQQLNVAVLTWGAQDAASSCWPEPPQAMHRLYGRHCGLG